MISIAFILLLTLFGGISYICLLMGFLSFKFKYGRQILFSLSLISFLVPILFIVFYYVESYQEKIKHIGTYLSKDSCNNEYTLKIEDQSFTIKPPYFERSLYGNWYHRGKFGAHNFYLINDADLKLKYDDHAI